MKAQLILGGVALVLSTGAFAQAKPDVLVKQRQSAMTLVGKYWGPLGGMSAGKVPYNAETVARNAAYLEVLSKMPWDGFTDATKDEKSRALPAVFTDTAKFKEGGDRMQNAIAGLVKVSRGGDEATVKGALGEVGKTCSGCHENFRAK